MSPALFRRSICTGFSSVDAQARRGRGAWTHRDCARMKGGEPTFAALQRPYDKQFSQHPSELGASVYTIVTRIWHMQLEGRSIGPLQELADAHAQGTLYVVAELERNMDIV